MVTLAIWCIVFIVFRKTFNKWRFEYQVALCMTSGVMVTMLFMMVFVVFVVLVGMTCSVFSLLKLGWRIIAIITVFFIITLASRLSVCFFIIMLPQW
jgi:hypothetical protein